VNREGKIEATLMRLTERAGRRMRGLGLLANGLSVSVGFKTPMGPRPQGPFWTPGTDGPGGSVHTRFAEPLDDSFALVGAALNSLRGFWTGQSVNFLAVTLIDLTIPRQQPGFGFANVGTRYFVGAQRAAPLQNIVSLHDRHHAVSSALDKIRDRYGLNSVVMGGMAGLGDEAPDRIGFRKTEGVDVIQTT
jgi:hypothetical protein